MNLIFYFVGNSMSQKNVAACQEIEGERFICKQYCKHAQFQNAPGRITGYALDGSKMKYAVIDFDWNKQLEISDEEKNEFLDRILNVFENKAKIVKTGSGGVHLYVIYDNAWKRDDIEQINRYVKVWKSERMDIDVFVSHIPKQSLVMLPNSEVKSVGKDNKVIQDSPIKYYVLKHNTEDDELISFTEALRILDQEINIKIDIDNSDYSLANSLLKELKSCDKSVKIEAVNVENYEEIIKEINDYEYKIIEEINAIDDPKCLELMLKCFKPVYENVEKLCCIIGASPFDKEILLKYFNSWYFFEGHTHNNLGTVNGYFTKYYKYEESNKWFYSCLKHLNDDVKNAFLNKFSFNTVDESIKMDIWETFTLKNIIKNIEENKYYTFTKNVITDKKLVKKAKELNEKKYGIEIIKTVNDDDTTKTTITINKYPKINYGKLITDLKKCFVIIDQTPMIYIFKDLDGSSGNFKFSETHKEAVACNKLKNRKLTYLDRELKEKSISLWDIIMQNNNSRHFTYSDSAFYSKKADVFSYYYNPFRINKDFDIEVDETKTDRTTMNNIELFWDHVKNVIAAGDETSYNYIKNWIIRPLQMPNRKNKSALIFAGIDQGTGKSWTAEIIARLHGRFGEENIGNMKDICGDFNAKLLNKTLVVANEVKNVDNSVWYNGDALKSLITDDKVGIEKKGIDSMTCDNNINFIFVSNNERPINIDDKDRRYAVFEPKPVHDKDDFDYWTDKFYFLKDDQQFLEDLYNWCLKQDISKFNPRNIPMTEAKLELIAQNRPRHEEFIIENIERFRDGFEKQECFDLYLYWCKKMNYSNPGNIKTFTNNLSNYIVWTQQKDSKSGNTTRVLPKKQICGKRSYVFKLTDEKYKELSVYTDDLDDESDEERPVLMRVDDDE